MGDGEGGVDEAFWDGGGVGEGLGGGDGVDEVEGLSGEGAGVGRGGGAGELGEGGKAHDGGEGLPLAFSAIRGDGAEAEGAEGAGAEELKWIEGGEDGVAVLHDEAAVFEIEVGGEGAVRVGDLDFFRAREAGLGFEEEEELRAKGDFRRGGELDGRGGSGGDAAGEDGDGGAGLEGNDRGVEEAAVVELDAGSEFVVRLDRRRGGAEDEREGERGGFGGFGVRGDGRRLEGGVLEGDELDFVKAGAGEGDGGVAGVVLDGLDLGGLGEGFGAELIRESLAELLDGELDGAGGGCVLEVEGEVNRVDGLGVRFGFLFGYLGGGVSVDVGFFIELPGDLLAAGFESNGLDAGGAG